MNSPLCATEPTGAWIHTGESTGLESKPRSIASGYSYNLVGCEHGSLRVDSDNLGSPAAVLVFPGVDQKIILNEGSTWWRTSFDVVYRPLRQGQHDGTRVHQSVATQPTPEAIWGRTIPSIIPKHLVRTCLNTLRDCERMWWRSPQCWAQANAHLGAWLHDYVALTGTNGGPLTHADRPHWLTIIEESLQSLEVGHLTIDDLARKTGLSRSSCSQLYRQHTGTTLRTAITEARMNRASLLLRTSSDSIEDILRSVGYRSRATFSRRFSERFGMPPIQWRRHRHSHGL